MRTGNLSSLSERDWASVRERRAFEQAEREKQLLSEDEGAYRDFVGIVNEQNQHLAPVHRIAPIPFEEWRTHADASISDPALRGAQATNAALLARVRRDEVAEAEAEFKQAREAVLAGQPDPAWKIPSSAIGLSMTVQAAKSFAKAQADAFLEATSYYPCKQNWDRLRGYIEAQGIVIPNLEVFTQAFERLSALGLLEHRPAPVQEPEPQQPQPDPDELRQQKRNEYLTKVVVTDPRTGQDYTEYQLDRLPADEYKRLMLGEFRTPRITDVIKPAWYRQ